MKRFDVGIAVLICVLAIQQTMAFGWKRAVAVAGALTLYYGVARLLLGLALKLHRRVGPRSQ